MIYKNVKMKYLLRVLEGVLKTSIFVILIIQWYILLIIVEKNMVCNASWNKYNSKEAEIICLKLANGTCRALFYGFSVK